MELYFAPLSSSFAARVTLYELDLPATYHRVSLGTKTVREEGDFWAVNAKGQVPALRTNDGVLLTEVPAVLQYLADLDPSHRLAPAPGSPQRYLLQQWLNYVASELHTAALNYIFNPGSPPEAKAFAREQLLPKRYQYLSNHLAERDHLLNGFTVADAYLTTTLNWSGPAGISLEDWPTLRDYHGRQMARPAVARAFQEELALYQAAT
jgi:glutathione S-transferase